MPEHTVDGVPIDPLTQSIMWLLRDADTRRCASELAEQLKDADASTVRFRIRKLREVGFVDHVESVENPGAQNPTKYYVINERGLEWLYEHQEDVEDAVGRKRYLDSLDQLREMVMDTRNDLRDLEDGLDDLDADLDNRLEERVDSVQKTVDRDVKKLKKKINEQEQAIERLEKDRERLHHLETRIDDLETELDDVDLRGLQYRQHELVKRVNTNYWLLKRVWKRMFYNARELQSLNFPKVLSADADPTEADESKPPMFDDIDPTDPELTAPEDDRRRWL